MNLNYQNRFLIFCFIMTMRKDSNDSKLLIPFFNFFGNFINICLSFSSKESFSWVKNVEGNFVWKLWPIMTKEQMLSQKKVFEIFSLQVQSGKRFKFSKMFHCFTVQKDWRISFIDAVKGIKVNLMIKVA